MFQNSKNWTKAGPQACPKPLRFCPDYISLPTEGVFLNFFDMINIDIYGFSRKFEPDRIVQSVRRLATDVCLTADPGVAS